MESLMKQSYYKKLEEKRLQQEKQRRNNFNNKLFAIEVRIFVALLTKLPYIVCILYLVLQSHNIIYSYKHVASYIDYGV